MESWIRVHVVVPGTSIFVHMHEHMWTRLQQGRGRRAVFICKSGSSRAMRLRCICNARRGGAWPGGTRVAHGQAGGELQSRKYDERWRDEGLSSNSDFTSLARVYEDVFTRGGATKLESYKFQRRSSTATGVNRCAYIVGYPGAPCRARPQAHRGPGRGPFGTRLGPLSGIGPRPPPPSPLGVPPLGLPTARQGHSSAAIKHSAHRGSINIHPCVHHLQPPSTWTSRH